MIEPKADTLHSDSPPNFFDFYSPQTKDFNVIAFNEATDNFTENQRKREIRGALQPPGKKAYSPRVQKIARDPKLSFWWTDYILDAQGVYDVPEDRNGKLFRQRFAYDKCEFNEVLHHIRGANIWSEKPIAANWSEMVESLLKDVECTFGILKAIFAILKYGCRFTDMGVMDNIFKTCCTIYNQKLLARGGDEPWVHFSTVAAGERSSDIYCRRRHK